MKFQFIVPDSHPLPSRERAGGAQHADSVAASPYCDPGFSAAVIAWQQQHGRHSLPWQQTRDAYRVWLSEIMLQQTQVAAVIPYYEKFLQSFPTVQALAAASSEAVMAHWSGLGYYTRARNLHACAKRIVAEYQGQFPADPALLQDLPGIGRSTAAAISAFSYGTVAAILDGNVKRVFARVFGIQGYPGSKPVEQQMWHRAHALLPSAGIEAYTQGLMDLGATLCTRTRPQCGACPLQTRCVARAQGRTAELPASKPKSPIRQKHALMLVLRYQDQVLLEQRPDNGIWGGLLSLPELGGMRVASEAQPDNLALALSFAQRYGQVQQLTPLPEISHVFTHFKLQIQPLEIRLSQRTLHAAQSAQQWLLLAAMADAALPAPVKKLLLGLQ